MQARAFPHNVDQLPMLGATGEFVKGGADGKRAMRYLKVHARPVYLDSVLSACWDVRSWDGWHLNSLCFKPFVKSKCARTCLRYKWNKRNIVNGR